MKNCDRRLLMISFRCPWPKDGGGYVLRFLNIARILAKNYKVDLLTVAENKEEEKCLDDLKEIFNSVVIFRHSKIDEYSGALRAFFSSKPLQVGYYYSRSSASWLEKNYLNYDLIFCSTIRTAEYVRNLNVKKIIDFIDAISLNYQQAIKNNGGLWKLIYKIENRRLLDYERKVVDAFDLSFITTQKDKDFIMGTVGENMVVLPNGVKEEVLERSFNGKEKNWLTFFGKMDYQPNEDACLFFARKVFPKIRKKIPDINFYIVGMNPTKKILDIQKIDGVKVTGKVNDPYSYLERSKIIVAPIRFGGGIQNKILEGMALRKTVLTTPVGASGIAEAEDEKHLVVVNYENQQEMAEKIIWLLKNNRLRHEIGKMAQKLISENYTWDKAEKKLFENLSTIL